MNNDDIADLLRSVGKAPHVLPRNDGVEHSADPWCVCGPSVTPTPEGIAMVHHSLDGREFSEEAPDV